MSERNSLALPGGDSELCIQAGSAYDTRAIGALLGSLLEGGEVIGLIGGLGAGKTCFVQGLAMGLGVPPEAYVCSPTFALWNHHQGRVPLFHVDLFRLADPEEAASMGYEDLFDGQAVVAIEWFDSFPELWPRDHLRVVLSDGIRDRPGSVCGPGALPRASTGSRGDVLGSVVTGGDLGSGPGEDLALECCPRTIGVRGVGPLGEDLANRFRAALASAKA